MNKFKRGLVYLKSNIGKSLIIFIVVFIAMLVISTCTIITQVNKKVIDDAYNGQQPNMFVYADYDNIDDSELDWTLEDPYAAFEPTVEDYETISKLEHVTDYRVSAWLSGDQIMTGPTADDGTENNYFSFTDAIDITETTYYSDGYTFDYDNTKLKTGNSIIVNDEVMELNNYQVGDTITINFESEYIEAIPEGYDAKEFTIVGTYNFTPTTQMISDEKKAAEEYGYEPDLSFSIYKTTIFMGSELTQSLVDDYTNLENADLLIGLDSSFKIDDSDNLEIVEAEIIEATGKQLTAELETPADADKYGAMTIMATMTSSISWIAGIVITILVTLIIILFIRGRKSEFGILMALGERKSNLYQQIIAEVGSIFLVASVISIPLGFVFGNIVNKSYTNYYWGMTTEVENLPFSFSAVIIIIIISIILTLVSTLIPTIYTLRMKPRKILL